MFRFKTKYIYSAMIAWLSILQIQAQTTAQQLSYDISFLASDALEGRLTGSDGEKKAAEYISQRFNEIKLKPLNNSYYQSFDIVKLRIVSDQSNLGMSIQNQSVPLPYKLNKDYCILSQSSENDSINGEIVDVNFGIEADSLGHNDFLNPEILKGKIFVMKLGHPESNNPHSKFAEYAEITQKIANAKKYGAIGVIFIKQNFSDIDPEGICETKRNEKSIGFPVVYLKFNHLPMPPSAKFFIKSKIHVVKSTANNVVGFRNNKKKNTIVICAHYDHLGYGEFGGSTYVGPQAIHNGADDNASGVAAMMALAKELQGKKYKKNNYLFIAFSGEEMGLLGSKYFIQNTNFDLKKINYVINIDMLGRLDSVRKVLLINGIGTSPNWKNTIEELQKTTDSNLIKIKTTESGLGASDHASFYLENIPVLHFFTGQHADYHKPSDDENKINYTGMVNSIEVIKNTIALNNKLPKLVFTKTKDAEPGKAKWKVSLGIMPDYTYTENGVRIDGVTEGRPASLAGLLKGDVIVKLAGFDTPNVETYMQILARMKKGDKVLIEYLRNKELKTSSVTF